MKTSHLLLCGLLLPSILLLANVSSVNATVGVEYLGPYPLNPKPTGDVQILTDSGTIGNSGTDPARVTLTLVADDEFKAHFTTAFSDNNFTLNSGERKTITFTFNSEPHTPTGNWTASIAIVAQAVNVPQDASPGKASFNLLVVINPVAAPEFPTTGVGLIIVFMFSITLFVSRRIGHHQRSVNIYKWC